MAPGAAEHHPGKKGCCKHLLPGGGPVMFRGRFEANGASGQGLDR